MSWQEVWRVWITTYPHPGGGLTFRDANRVFERAETIEGVPGDLVSACAFMDRLYEEFKMEELL